MNGLQNHSFTWLSLWHPELVVSAVLLYVLYLYVTYFVERQPKQNEGKSTLKHAGFIVYLAVSYAAMGSPLAAAAQVHGFSFFIVQMLLMTMVMPWLLLLSLPVWLIDAALEAKFVYRIVHALTRPETATALYNLATSLFLIPVIFNANLRYNWLHIIDQSILMVLGICLWWPLVSQSSILPQPRQGVQLLYILFSVNFMMPITVLLLIAHSPWYNVYQNTPWPISWSHLADQQAGAIFMLLGMGLAYGIRAFSIYLKYDTNKWYE